jgi:hypothetical protein
MWVKRIINDKKLILLVVVTLLIRLFSINPSWIEQYYTYGAYPYIAKALRLLFGWIPFPVGDIIYFLAGLYLAWLSFKFVKHARHLNLKNLDWTVIVKKALKTILLIYILFNVLWGLNYDRQGIAQVMKLKVDQYETEDVQRLTSALHQQVNYYAAQTQHGQRRVLSNDHEIYALSIASFKTASKRYPFLAYNTPSIKGSLYSGVGHIFGFTGYYNPFTGEAQLKTSVPNFLKPFIVNHEIGHQVGFGKENEANFVAYLAGKESTHNIVRYSTYFEAYLYAVRDLRRRDSSLANAYQDALHPQVKEDIETLILYYKRSENQLEPYFARFYDQYLKMNRQPKGTRTYNEVVAWMIAYQKKYGMKAI